MKAELAVGAWWSTAIEESWVKRCCDIDVSPSARGTWQGVQGGAASARMRGGAKMCEEIIPCAAAAYGKRRRREGGEEWRAVILA